MSNFVYPKFVLDTVLGLVGDYTSLTWKCTAVSTDVFDNTDEFLVDLGSVLLGTPVTLTTIAVDIASDGGVEVTTDDSPPLSLTGITSSDTPKALVVYIDTGSSATSNLVAWFDHRADTSPVLFTGNGDAIPLTFPMGFVIKL